MKTKREIICPMCGKEIEKPFNLINAKQFQKAGLIDSISVDKTLQEHIIRYGGVLPPDEEKNELGVESQLLHQIVYDDEAELPEEIRRYVYNGQIMLKFGSEEISHKACQSCHSDITPLIRNDIKTVKNVLLIGLPGSSKTTDIASIAKLLIERNLTGKSEKLEIGATSDSFEYLFYSSIAEKFPIIPSQTFHDKENFNRQPLFYVIINNVLLIFHDFPGEAIKENFIIIPDNAIPVYLYDEFNVNKDKQAAFFDRVIKNLHENSQFEKEVLAFVKCDKLASDFVSEIMFKPYEDTTYNKFDGLLAARRMAMLSKHKNHHQMYYKLRGYNPNIDIVCFAGLGCETHSDDIDSKGNTVYVLDKEWSPMYLYDFLLTLGG